MRRKFFTVAILAALVMTVTAAQAGERFKLGFTSEIDSNYHKGAIRFQELVAEYTGGEIIIDVFPASQLGSERDLIEGTSLGTVEMCISSSGPLSNFSSDFMVMDLPYLVTSREKLFTTLDGPIGQQILATLEPANLKGMGFWENGFRCLTNNRAPIESPSELAGMKIRTMENPIHQYTFNNYGATAVPMAWNEVFIAMQQGVIDGHENAINSIWAAKVYEVQKYLSLTFHFYSPAILLMNNDLYNSLSDKHREQINRAAFEAMNYERQYSADIELQLIDELKKKGMIVVEVDVEEWKKASAKVYEEFRDKIKPEYMKAFIGE
ncbi:MAG: TRAP transporter substrate-binding protein [Planctomycetaceae bacterium]|nr:TRAP transporter substrate-binding protein [Planctomycetaceae bacterium]